MVRGALTWAEGQRGGNEAANLEKEQEPWERDCKMVHPLEGSPDRTARGEARREWVMNHGPLGLFSLPSPEGQRVRVMRSTDINLLGYRAGQREGVAWWWSGTRGEYPAYPPHPLCLG